MNDKLLLAKILVLVAAWSGIAWSQTVSDNQSDLIGQMMRYEPVPDDGEEEEPIETDRDSFTPTTTLTGQHAWIVEAAYSYVDNRNRADTHSYPEFLLRYGAWENIEFRLGYNFEVGGAGNEISSGGSSDFEDFSSQLEREHSISYGLKAAVTKQNGWIPRSAAILQASTPLGGEANDTQLVADYVAGWELLNKMQFDTSLRYSAASDRQDHFDIWAPSAVFKVPLGEKWNVHAEYFALFSDHKEDEFTKHFFSPGAHYLVRPNLEIGLRVGWGLNHDSANYFSNAGLGWKF